MQCVVTCLFLGITSLSYHQQFGGQQSGRVLFVASSEHRYSPNRDGYGAALKRFQPYGRSAARNHD
jgi:hypothetical protein